MWAVTGWALRTWLKLTVALAVAVGVAWLALGGTGWFALVCVGAVVAQVHTVRGLAREWSHEARSSWWWSR